MLIEVCSKRFAVHFPSDPHPFISESFIELNKGKAERIVRLIDDGKKPSIGLVAGVKDKILYSPFSAPFGGFHFSHEIIYINEIDYFLNELKKYIISMELTGIEIVLPPDIYYFSFNAKTINSLIRNGFHQSIPEITNYINLHNFQGIFTQKNSREYYRQADRNNLAFDIVIDSVEKRLVYDLICMNRAKFNRPIYMTLSDIEKTGEIWPVDYFKVSARDGSLVASAILYRSHPTICYAVFWGDNEIGRPLRAMDFLVFNLCLFYKEKDFKFLDLGISTELGIPNVGLLRFKESHDAISSLRYKFFWKA